VVTTGTNALDGALWIDGAEDPALAYELKATKAFGFGPRRGFE
jgi:hypothetical protein